MNKKVLHILILHLTSLIVFGQHQFIDNQQIINDFLNEDAFKNASIGVQIIDVNTEEELINHQENKSLIPASIQKLITTSTALEIFGPNYKFKTYIQYDGYIVDNILYGNIYIKGSGDPSLNSTYFEKNYDLFERWSSNIISILGITDIKGDIIGDASLFPNKTNDKWLWEDIANYYGASPNALSYHDNLYYIYLQSGIAGSKTKILYTKPFHLNLQFDNQVIAYEEDKDKAFIFGDKNCNFRTITGNIPQNKVRFRIKGALPDPALTVAQMLKNALEHKAIVVEGKAKSLYEKNNFNRTDIFTHHSEFLADIIKITNEESVNLYAELLLQHIGLHLGNDPQVDSATVSMLEFWDKKVFDTDGLFLYDGSGLSPFNATTTSFYNRLLTYMYKHSYYKKEFINSLAISGEEGTLKWFGTNPPLKSNFVAKSGSMTKVIAYSGYLKTANNRMLACTIIINNYDATYTDMKYMISKFFDKIYLLY